MIVDVTKELDKGVSYRDLLYSLEDRACSECGGSGECDDAGPGDIAYNTYKCSACNGRGITIEDEGAG